MVLVDVMTLAVVVFICRRLLIAPVVVVRPSSFIWYFLARRRVSDETDTRKGLLDEAVRSQRCRSRYLSRRGPTPSRFSRTSPRGALDWSISILQPGVEGPG